jgi:trehalose 6-phosphate phosphatase
MRPSTRRWFLEVARRYPTVVISGRARPDVGGRLAGAAVLEVIGNHGADAIAFASRATSRMRRFRVALEGLTAIPGVEIEDKGLTLSVHTRRCRDKAAALAAVTTAVTKLRGARIVSGKQIVNVLPAGAPHKGDALAAALARHGGDAAIYVGDDETDEDVFALARSDGWLLGIRVRAKRTSRASHFLRSQTEIDDLLRVLVRLRR